MSVSVTDFNSGLTRARAIMRVANLTSDHRQFTKPDRDLVKDTGVPFMAVNRQVVATVDGAVGGHPDLDTERVEHVFRGGKLVHLRTLNQIDDFTTKLVVVAKRIETVSGNESADIDIEKRNTRKWAVQKCIDTKFAHRLASSVSRWPTGENRSIRLWKPRRHTAELVRAEGVFGLDGAEDGSDAQIAKGFNDDVSAVKNPGFPRFASPVFRQWSHTRILNDFLMDGHTDIPNRNNRNLIGAHERRLAEHDPSIEVSCPHCGQRFLQNGWTGFTPLDGVNYGQRSWSCPTCGADMHEAINRPQKVAVKKFAESSDDLSYSLDQSDPCPTCHGSQSLNGQRCWYCWGTGKAIPTSTTTPLSPPSWHGQGTGRHPVMSPWDWEKALHAIHDEPWRQSGVADPVRLWGASKVSFLRTDPPLTGRIPNEYGQLVSSQVGSWNTS